MRGGVGVQQWTVPLILKPKLYRYSNHLYTSNQDVELVLIDVYTSLSDYGYNPGGTLLMP